MNKAINKAILIRQLEKMDCVNIAIQLKTHYFKVLIKKLKF